MTSNTVKDELSSKEKENLKLLDLIDVPAIQSLMDEFYKLTHMGIGIIDINGCILVTEGWQDICMKFHRCNPETNKNCLESDYLLSQNVSHGEVKLYKCKNNMWDMVTPIMLKEQHIGNIFLGQFLFDDEKIDYDLFRNQAKKYGFDEKEYLESLEKVPRYSKEKVYLTMSFYAKFATLISEMSLKNLHLSNSLIERDKLLKSLNAKET